MPTTIKERSTSINSLRNNPAAPRRAVNDTGGRNSGEAGSLSGVAARLPNYSRYNLSTKLTGNSSTAISTTESLGSREKSFSTPRRNVGSLKTASTYVMGGNNVSRNAEGSGSAASTNSHVDSNSFLVIENEKYDSARARQLIDQLRIDVKQKDARCQQLELELAAAHNSISEKDQDNRLLRTEIDKLKSVLQLMTVNKADVLVPMQSEKSNIPSSERAKRLGVSGESAGGQLSVELKHYEKDFRCKQLIREAILENDLTKNLEKSQVNEIVDCMYEKKIAPGSFIIREGESGQHLYVSEEGELEVMKDNKVLGIMGPGRCFGELALLYNCNRTASVRANTSAKLWTLDRRVFQAIMIKTGIQRTEEHVSFLKSVPLLKALPDIKLTKIADVLEQDFYSPKQHIIREGETGNIFFIIKSGTVQVTQLVLGKKEPQEIRVLGKGDYFGEKALLSEDCRTANVIALAPGVEVLTLDRNSFTHLIGDLKELKEKDYEDEKRGAQSGTPIAVIDNQFSHLRLAELSVIATLGMGGFGRVELVAWSKDKSKTFALKCLKKKHIVDTRQQDHVHSEKKIMMESDSPFICKLYKTFKDNKYVYMLLEACLGGELWTILRDRENFDDQITRFAVGCVLDAFQYIHSRGIIYRDLKPENLLLDNNGYIKLCDFGFAKKIGQGRKTWTFCGTPEYVAPEIILNKGHDFAADYWSLGILMYELLTGTPPFSANDPMKIYNIILKGIDAMEFSKKISRNANILIKKLCRDNPSERLGYGRGGIADIKKQRFFQGFDWDGLASLKMTPPLMPTGPTFIAPKKKKFFLTLCVKSSSDTTNFDNYPLDGELPPDEFSGWDADF